MAVDPLLISHTDLQSIRGNFSENISEDQVNPYIQEAQMQELRRFLGDELYLELISEYDLTYVTPSVIDLLQTNGGFEAGLGGTGSWVKGQGWELTFIGFLDVQTFGVTYQDNDVINGSFTAALGAANPVDVQLLDSTDTPVEADLGISVTADGVYTFNLTVPVSFSNPAKIRITPNSGWGSGSIYITRFTFDVNNDTSLRMFNLMRGEEYTNTRAAFRDKVKASAYHHKSMALSRQRDAYNYLLANKDIYPEWLNSTRIPKRKSFEINKIPKNGNSYYLR
jgi:hypothetical protein